ACHFEALLFDVCVESGEIPRPIKSMKENTPMKYAFLIYSSEEVYNKMSKQEQEAVYQGHFAFSGDIQQRGIVAGGEALQPINTATTVRLRNGKTVTTDGPFAETKEQLGGFYIIECKDLDEAIEMAKKIPDASFGSVEVRPVMVFPQ